MTTRMCFDDVAWERNDAEFDAWRDKLYLQDTLREIGNFIVKHRGGSPEELFAPIGGGFNICLRMNLKDGGSAIIRFPRPGSVFSPEEKVRKEVAVMRFVAEKTAIPVPFIFHYGMTEESPAGMVPRPAGIADWAATYKPRLELFLKALEAKEQEMISASRLTEAERLSVRMREYWETKDFWVSYAARKSWAVDMVFWEMLGKKFLGDEAGFNAVVSGFSGDERKEMERVVKRKLEESETRTLDHSGSVAPVSI